MNADDIKQIIEATCDLSSIGGLDSDTSFASVGLDSLDIFNILLAIEEECGVKFPEERTDEFKSIESIESFLSNSSNE